MGEPIRFESVSLSFAQAPRERNIYRRLFMRRYGTRKALFCDLNLKVEAGEVIALVGPNGSGKTTLLKLTAGILFPHRGQIQIGDRTQPFIERRKLGLMLTTQMLYGGLTGHQNLDYTARLYGSVDIEASIDHAVFFWGLTDYIDAPVVTYSAGMKARLAIARATLHRPQVLLLDEPTVFLDSDGVDRLKKYLRVSQATTLITTHQTETLAEHLDRVVSVETLRAA